MVRLGDPLGEVGGVERPADHRHVRRLELEAEQSVVVDGREAAMLPRLARVWRRGRGRATTLTGLQWLGVPAHAEARLPIDHEELSDRGRCEKPG